MVHDFNPLVQRELWDTLDHYEAVTDVKGEQFYQEFQSCLREILENPKRFPPVPDSGLRKAHLKNFPYSILYEIQSSKIRVLALRHHSRHPNYGLRRK